jgi:hypothetical protein
MSSLGRISRGFQHQLGTRREKQILIGQLCDNLGVNKEQQRTTRRNGDGTSGCHTTGRQEQRPFARLKGSSAAPTSVQRRISFKATEPLG